MEERINAGYRITSSISFGETEIVLGERANPHDGAKNYVTWECQHGNNYMFGHYFDDLLSAMRSYLSRAETELEVMERSRKQEPVLDAACEDPYLKRYVFEVTREQHGSIEVSSNSFAMAAKKAYYYAQKGQGIDWYDYEGSYTIEEATDFYRDSPPETPTNGGIENNAKSNNAGLDSENVKIGCAYCTDGKLGKCPDVFSEQAQYCGDYDNRELPPWPKLEEKPETPTNGGIEDFVKAFGDPDNRSSRDENIER